MLRNHTRCLCANLNRSDAKRVVPAQGGRIRDRHPIERHEDQERHRGERLPIRSGRGLSQTWSIESGLGNKSTISGAEDQQGCDKDG